MVRIVVVDDHPVVREGLTAVLSDEPEFKVVGQAESGEGAIASVVRLVPNVVVMDMRLPGISGIEACQRITRRHPSIRVVILATFPNGGAIARAFAAGATAFVLKRSELAELREAVRAVARGDQYIDPRLAPKVAAMASGDRRAKGPFDLTLMEMRVLEKLPLGMTNTEIGEALGIKQNTVKTHLRTAMYKIKAKDRAHAAAIAVREGLG